MNQKHHDSLNEIYFKLNIAVIELINIKFYIFKYISHTLFVIYILTTMVLEMKNFANIELRKRFKYIGYKML